MENFEFKKSIGIKRNLMNISSYFNKRSKEVDENSFNKNSLFFKDGGFDDEQAERKIIRLDDKDLEIKSTEFSWKIISQKNLNLKYGRVFKKSVADNIFHRLEHEIEYFSGDLTKVRVYGKWCDIPRKQVSYGSAGLSYTFSGTSVPAIPWDKCPIVSELKKCVESITGQTFNFVLINRYKNGEDHMGEHRDDEKDLVADAPIASLSFGQNRDFIFKHKDSRGKKAIAKIPPLKLLLEHGSLLLMEWPTNKFWYHSLPVRKNAVNVRVNLTFRRMVV